MKKSVCLLVCLSAVLFFAGCSTSSDNTSSTPFTVTALVEETSASSYADNPAVLENTNYIDLVFSEELDFSSISGNTYLYRINGTGEPVPLDAEVTSLSPAIVRVSLAGGDNFISGNEYLIAVKTGAASASGKTIAHDYTGYFTPELSFDIQSGSLELEEGRKQIVVISDLHLGDMRAQDENYGWQIENRIHLENFLLQLRVNPTVKELVIAGDMFDEWVCPMEYDTFGGKDENGFFNDICDANDGITDALNNIIEDGNIKVTYVPGNHDMLVTSEDMDARFPGINNARDDVGGVNSGLGSYTPDGRSEIVIEHSHRYDFFNAPDSVSNASVTGQDTILAPGFFVTKDSVTSLRQHPQVEYVPNELYGTGTLGEAGNGIPIDLYQAAWMPILIKYPTDFGWEEKSFRTGIDGFTETYSYKDVIGNNSTDDRIIYKDNAKASNWDNLQTINNVPEHIAVLIAILNGVYNPLMDLMSGEYFYQDGCTKRIVVFGHTHMAMMSLMTNSYLKKIGRDAHSIYANTGTWVDKVASGYPPQSFIVITPFDTIEFVDLYSYNNGSPIRKDGRCISLTR
jgi:UDP-2,3-diacylglucosamine pyrophosphatase LpxH